METFKQYKEEPYDAQVARKNRVESGSKAKPSEWTCVSCLSPNSAAFSRCVYCKAPQPEGDSAAAAYNPENREGAGEGEDSTAKAASRERVSPKNLFKVQADFSLKGGNRS